MKYLLTVALIFLGSSTAYSECVGRELKYMQIQILSCLNSDQFALSNIEKEKYSPSDIEKLKSSAKYVSVADVLILADVDIIEWYSKNGRRTFKGEISPIKTDSKRKLMLIGVDLEACGKYYKGISSLFMVDEHFSCCRDDISPDRKETTAQCLTKLPSAAKFGSELEQLHDIGIKLPSESR